MIYDSVNERGRQLPVPTQQQVVSYVSEQTRALVPDGRRRGKPATLTTLHLCLGVVLCGLEGFGSQLKLWRRLCLEPMGPFAPVQVVEQAVYNRLARAAGVMRAFFEQVSAWMSEQMAGLEDRRLAPFLGRYGREVGLIRPSSRLRVEVPLVDPSWITPAPPEALRARERKRYAQRKCAPGPRTKTKKAG